MLGRSRVARRYAEAVLQLARERDTVDQWAVDLAYLAEVLERPEIHHAVKSPRVPFEEKSRLIAAALDGRSPLLFNLARLLIRRGRAGVAPGLAEEYGALRERLEGVQRFRVTTAIPLREEERARLRTRLAEAACAPVSLETSVDPSIIGGMIVQAGDQLIDGSVRTKLEAMREALAAPL